MQSNNAKYIKGLAIAVVVLSILTLVGVVIGFVALMVGQGFINANAAELFTDAYYSGSHHGLDYQYGLSTTETVELMNILWGIMYLGLAWEFVVGIITLVPGIMGLRSSTDSSKMGAIMGWSIGGAIAAFLSGRIITTILLVVLAVFANKAKNPVAGYGNPAAGYAGNPYGAVPPQSPAGYGYGAPQNPAQPYATPTDPQTAAAQQAYQQAYGAPAQPVTTFSQTSTQPVTTFGQTPTQPVTTFTQTPENPAATEAPSSTTNDDSTPQA